MKNSHKTAEFSAIALLNKSLLFFTVLMIGNTKAQHINGFHKLAGVEMRMWNRPNELDFMMASCTGKRLDDSEKPISERTSTCYKTSSGDTYCRSMW